MTRDELRQAIVDTLAEIEAVKQQIEAAAEELRLMRPGRRNCRLGSCGI